MKIEQAPTARDLARREHAPVCFIVHGTGESDLQRILRFYQSRDGLQPHYVINTDGVIYQLADVALVAFHAATPKTESSLYRLGWQNWSRFIWKDDKGEHIGGEFPGYRGWRETWFDRGYQSPLDLLPGGKTNQLTIGIELVTPTKKTTKLYHPAQYQALADLLTDCGNRNGIKLSRETVLGHSDTNPLRRCNAQGSWDPGYQFDFNYLWDLVTARPSL